MFRGWCRFLLDALTTPKTGPALHLNAHSHFQDIFPDIMAPIETAPAPDSCSGKGRFKDREQCYLLRDQETSQCPLAACSSMDCIASTTRRLTPPSCRRPSCSCVNANT